MSWSPRVTLSPRSLILGLPAALLVGLSGFAAGTQRAAVQAPPTKIGVVDMDELLKGYAGYEEHNSELEAESKRIRAELDEMGKALAQQETDASLWEQGTEERARAEWELGLARTRFRETQRFYEYRLEQKFRQMSVEIFAELQAGVGDFAAKNGFAMIFRDRNHDADASTGTRFDINQHRDLLWHAEQVNVTAAVIDHLKSWKAR